MKSNLNPTFHLGDRILVVCVLLSYFRGMGAFYFEIKEASLTQHCWVWPEQRQDWVFTVVLCIHTSFFSGSGPDVSARSHKSRLNGHLWQRW